MAIVFILLTVIVSGCATSPAAHYDTRPFYLAQQDVEGHGRKTWFDHLVEVDPGRVKFTLAKDYANDPPVRIAVLPFVDQGTAQYVVDKIPLSFRNQQERNEWAWTYANRLRKSVTGQLAEREFEITPLPAVDAVLQDHGIDDWKKLQAVAPEQLGQWLGVDTVVYGQVLHYDAFYAFLVAGWQVGAHVRMVSTQDGHEIFDGTDTRDSVDLRPAFDLMDIALNSGLTLLELRDITLARAEDEVAREIIKRVPISDRNVTTLEMAARQKSWSAPAPENALHTETGTTTMIGWAPAKPPTVN
jgi:Putative bacterial lipoprotein (DUF799)